MEQKKFSFDPVTVAKLKRSALIALSGFVITAIPLLLPEVAELLKDKPTLVALITVVATWIGNTIKEYMKGK